MTDLDPVVVVVALAVGSVVTPLLFADIDLGAITIAKSFADPVGHYSRPDVTRLLFNPQVQDKVEMPESIFLDLATIVFQQALWSFYQMQDEVANRCDCAAYLSHR